MYKTIVVPVDLAHSDKAVAMLETADRLGGQDTKIVLTNIIEEIPAHIAAELAGGYVERAKAAAIEEFSQIAKSTTLETEIEVRTGYPSAGILTVADEKKADAIVIASHRPGFEDYFLGSTASRVVRHAKCTVVVMR